MSPSLPEHVSDENGTSVAESFGMVQANYAFGPPPPGPCRCGQLGCFQGSLDIRCVRRALKSMNRSPSLPSTAPARLRVAAVQMIFADSIPGNLEKIERAVAAAQRRGAEVILFPECATTGYACAFGALKPAEVRSALQAVASMAARYGVNLLVGSPIFAGRRLYNALVVFDRSGRLAHVYAKCQLVESDLQWFTPGNGLSLFSIDGVPATSIICHERRYPELVRLPVMAGARIVFHPNAGMDALRVSRTKRNGRDGMAVRAFENSVFYVFANSVGPQGAGKWSAGDSKVVAPDGSVLKLADNRSETVVVADLDLAQATGKYAEESLRHPRFLAPYWRALLRDLRRRARESDLRFQRAWRSGPDSRR